MTRRPSDARRPRLLGRDLEAPAWRPVLVDADRPLPELCADGAAGLLVTVLTGGRAVGRVLVPVSADPVPAAELATVIDHDLAELLQLERLRTRLVMRPSAAVAGPTATVLVCTCDRPEDLRRCLGSIARLEPSVEEVLVVDNGSKPDLTREIVAEADARYVREPVAGLDRARNRGCLMATGQVLLCTDDDVEVEPGWAAALLAPFEDPLVMAATGLVLPALLDTPARWHFERHSSFIRGWKRKVLDGSLVPSAVAGSAGAGASMAVRAEFVSAMGGFPEELDAGMATGSGGDSYCFYRVLRAGYRLVYEPTALARHTHRETAAALENAYRGYGTGIWSWALRALHRDHDPMTFLLVTWWGGCYLGRKMAASLLRRRGALPLRISFAGLRGALAAPAAYRASCRAIRGREPVLVPAGVGRPLETPVASPLPAAASPSGRLPSLSVVIPSRGRRESLLRLLGALALQDYPTAQVEVIVAIDGDLDGSDAAIRAERWPWPVRAVLLESPGRSLHEGNGAAVARNRGAAIAEHELLLFLDDDVIPAGTGVLLAHARAHEEQGVAVIGPCPPHLLQVDGFWAQQVRNWWIDQSERLVRNANLTFTDVLTGNLSLTRRTFAAIGGFTPMPRREDWELGYRLQRAGIGLRAAPAAAVVHDADLSLQSALEDRRREGAGDVSFATAHPEVLAQLPLAALPGLGRATRRAAELAITRNRAVGVCLLSARGALALLERSGLRREFSSLLRRAQFMSYWSGVGTAVGDLAGWRALEEAGRTAAGPAPTFDLRDDASLPTLDGAAEVRVAYGGVELGRAPVLWGGLPFDGTQFTETIVHRFAYLTIPHDGAPDELAAVATRSARA